MEDIESINILLSQKNIDVNIINHILKIFIFNIILNLEIEMMFQSFKNLIPFKQKLFFLIQ